MNLIDAFNHVEFKRIFNNNNKIQEIPNEMKQFHNSITFKIGFLIKNLAQTCRSFIK